MIFGGVQGACCTAVIAAIAEKEWCIDRLERLLSLEDTDIQLLRSQRPIMRGGKDLLKPFVVLDISRLRETPGCIMWLHGQYVTLWL